MTRTTIERLAETLEAGAGADIWYDAQDFADRSGSQDDPDHALARTIDDTQDVMTDAARVLLSMHAALVEAHAVALKAGSYPEGAADRIQAVIDAAEAPVEDDEPEASAPGP